MTTQDITYAPGDEIVRAFSAAKRIISRILALSPRSFDDEIYDRLNRSFDNVYDFVGIVRSSEGASRSFYQILNQVMHDNIREGRTKSFVRVFTALSGDYVINFVQPDVITGAVEHVSSKDRLWLVDTLARSFAGIKNPQMKIAFLMALHNANKRRYEREKGLKLCAGIVRLAASSVLKRIRGNKSESRPDHLHVVASNPPPVVLPG